ncbi:hypothetical protein [Burkholderia gladioli]|uniref:hypothetical protein n=1 Tax=Burkholderia gladioli TaxID=28095 RepID=UPI003015FA42
MEERGKQEFIGPVGDVAGRDVVNNNFGHGRLLTKGERIDLNRRVQMLEMEFGVPGWRTWKFLHRTIGIDNIESMHLIHRDPADAILELLQEVSRLQRAAPSNDPSMTTSAPEARPAEAQTHALSTLLHSAQAQLVSARTRYWVAVIVMLAAIACAAGLGAKVWFDQRALAALDQCSYAGNVYAVGAIIDNPSAPDIECVMSAGKKSPEWRELKEHRRK